jgi:hypothetical protein
MENLTAELNIILCLPNWGIDQFSAFFGIATPIILLFWFLYTQKQTLSKRYFSRINGVYSGFTKQLTTTDNNKVNSGIILNIRDTDDNGFFKGELDFKEVENQSEILIEGLYTFLGKLEFDLYFDKKRHPFKPAENRIYRGRLYIVDRLDFLFDEYKIEDYLSAEYDVVHYREMETLKFTLRKNYKETKILLPNHFTLYKSMGFNFEPYKNVKRLVFSNQSFSDKC